VSDVIVCDEDFDVGLEYSRLCDASPHSGAVVFFVGLVRDMYDVKESNSSTNTIEYLELEHYPGMTESLCQDIIDEAENRYSFDNARVIHRVGKLYANQQIVMVAVASRHRENAFQAAQFIMDYLKTRATFWKKEVGAKGEHWLGVKEKDIDATERWSNKS
jgi:molybdopterin synthase catalytic subunit